LESSPKSRAGARDSVFHPLMDTATCLKALTSLAIFMSAYGVGILFVYGVPLDLRVLSHSGRTAEPLHVERRAAALWSDRARWAGLAMGLMGAALQAWVIWRG
jgi:hypothetical protein